jgi:Sel1 repeat
VRDVEFVFLAMDYAMLTGNEALVEDLTNGFGSCSRGFTLQRVTNLKLFAAGAIKNSLLLENRYPDSQQIERLANIDEEIIWYQKGMLPRIIQNIKTLSVLLSSAAEAGDGDAQFNLARMFELGEGVKVNPVKAVEWYQKGMLSRVLQNINTLSALLSPAAETGHVKAQFNLGLAFKFGKGVEANPVKAVEWIQKGMFVANSSK